MVNETIVPVNHSLQIVRPHPERKSARTMFFYGKFGISYVHLSLRLPIECKNMYFFFFLRTYKFSSHALRLYSYRTGRENVSNVIALYLVNRS